VLTVDDLEWRRFETLLDSFDTHICILVFCSRLRHNDIKLPDHSAGNAVWQIHIRFAAGNLFLFLSLFRMLA